MLPSEGGTLFDKWSPTLLAIDVKILEKIKTIKADLASLKSVDADKGDVRKIEQFVLSLEDDYSYNVRNNICMPKAPDVEMFYEHQLEELKKFHNEVCTVSIWLKAQLIATRTGVGSEIFVSSRLEHWVIPVCMLSAFVAGMGVNHILSLF